MFLYICRMQSNLSVSHHNTADYLRELHNPEDLLTLFDFLPNVAMDLKDASSRYLRVNRFACQLLGIAAPQSAQGRTDFDFYPPAIATQYVDEDRRVLASGKPLIDQVWLVPGVDGLPRWYLCSKLPLRDTSGELCGVAGIKRPYEQAGQAASGYSRLMKVVEYVSENYSEPIETPDMAAHAGLSASQLQREFARLFGISPNRYLREIRIGVARRLLETSDDSISLIASSCGFYDQSHFSRQFKASTGMPPLQYRKRYRPARSE